MFAQVSAASWAGSGQANEDFFLTSNDWAMVLDGVTRYPDDGCIHNVPWYVASLGNAVARQMANPNQGLRLALVNAIEAVVATHSATCDMQNLVSPAATVALVRHLGEVIEWLVLGDCSVAWRDNNGEVSVRSDDRLARLEDPPEATLVGGIRRYGVDYIAQVRNRPGGFWVASTDGASALQAYTGEVSTASAETVGLFSDGATRLVERYGYSWEGLMSTAVDEGVTSLLTSVRDKEKADLAFRERAKRHDDATGIIVTL